MPIGGDPKLRPDGSRTAAWTPALLERQTFASRLQETLRDDIVSGVLLPGRRLPAAEIARRYGVSATPLREALQRLHAEGMVQIDAQGGARVAAISPAEFRDIYAVRRMLEPEAVRRAIERGTPEWIADLGRKLESLHLESASSAAHRSENPTEARRIWAEAHKAFHETLYAPCDSVWLLRFISLLYQHSGRYRMLLKHEDLPSQWLAGHDEIVAAAKRKDADTAAETMKTLLHRAEANLEQTYAARGAVLEDPEHATAS